MSVFHLLLGRCQRLTKSKVKTNIIRSIHVTTEFIMVLSAFLRRNTEYSKSLFLKVVKRIKDLFVYTIKTGFRDPLIKKNG